MPAAASLEAPVAASKASVVMPTIGGAMAPGTSAEAGHAPPQHLKKRTSLGQNQQNADQLAINLAEWN